MNFIYSAVTFFIFIYTPVSCVPKDHQENGYCGLNGYEAHCVLDIMEEHIEATAIVNHCHIPLDITFRVIYRFGNGSEQRWQYTFVTTNQNERVLIPGLTLPPAPHSLVYLYVRVPETIFDLHNASLVAIEASFIAVLSDDMWEEAEFLDEVITVNTTEDCYKHERNNDPLLWIIGGALLGLLFVGATTTGVLWWYRRKKIALDELALVTSIETGLPGAQPYQIGLSDQRINNNNVLNELTKESQKLNQESQSSGIESSNKVSAFRFNRLKEESPEERKEKIAKKLGKAIVIGNPVLVDKTSLLQTRFNRMANTGYDKSKPVKNIEAIGDAFKNEYSIDEGASIENSEDSSGSRRSDSVTESDESDIKPKHWKQHPLEACDSKHEDVESTSVADSGARPKEKLGLLNSHEAVSSDTQDSVSS